MKINARIARLLEGKETGRNVVTKRKKHAVLTRIAFDEAPMTRTDLRWLLADVNLTDKKANSDRKGRKSDRTTLGLNFRFLIRKISN